jgi:DNA replication protein DnaC
MQPPKFHSPSRIQSSFVTRICRSELIVIDDIGQLPAGQDEAEALYRLVDAAYERRSLVLTSNLAPSAFDTILPKGLATATVDRLLHHAHVVVTEGRSQRLEDALAGRGVVPLPHPADDGLARSTREGKDPEPPGRSRRRRP